MGKWERLVGWWEDEGSSKLFVFMIENRITSDRVDDFVICFVVLLLCLYITKSFYSRRDQQQTASQRKSQ